MDDLAQPGHEFPPQWPEPEQVLDCNCLFGPWPRAPLDASFVTVMDLLARAGIGAAVVGSLRVILGSAGTGNLDVLRACAARPNLIPAAGLRLREELDLEGRVDWCAEQGFRLLRLYPEYEGWPPGFRPLELALEHAARLGLPVHLTLQQPGEFTTLGSVLARTGATLIAAGVNVSHTPLLSEAVAVCGDCPGLRLETSRLEGADTVDILCETLGPDRLVFGTGLPFVYPSSALALIACSRLPERDRRMILRENLLQLLAVH